MKIMNTPRSRNLALISYEKYLKIALLCIGCSILHGKTFAAYIHMSKIWHTPTSAVTVCFAPFDIDQQKKISDFVEDLSVFNNQYAIQRNKFIKNTKNVDQAFFIKFIQEIVNKNFTQELTGIHFQGWQICPGVSGRKPEIEAWKYINVVIFLAQDLTTDLRFENFASIGNSNAHDVDLSSKEFVFLEFNEVTKFIYFRDFSINFFTKVLNDKSSNNFPNDKTDIDNAMLQDLAILKEQSVFDQVWRASFDNILKFKNDPTLIYKFEDQAAPLMLSYYTLSKSLTQNLRRFKFVVLHEFGHLAGLAHSFYYDVVEQKNDPIFEEFDKNFYQIETLHQKIYLDLDHTPEMKKNFQAFTSYDPYSVMTYSLNNFFYSINEVNHRKLNEWDLNFSYFDKLQDYFATIKSNYALNIDDRLFVLGKDAHTDQVILVQSSPALSTGDLHTLRCAYKVKSFSKSEYAALCNPTFHPLRLLSHQ